MVVEATAPRGIIAERDAAAPAAAQPAPAATPAYVEPESAPPPADDPAPVRMLMAAVQDEPVDEPRVLLGRAAHRRP